MQTCVSIPHKITVSTSFEDFKASNFDSTSGTSMVNFVFEIGWQSISFKVVLSGSTVALRPCNVIKVKRKGYVSLDRLICFFAYFVLFGSRKKKVVDFYLPNSVIYLPLFEDAGDRLK